MMYVKATAVGIVAVVEAPSSRPRQAEAAAPKLTGATGP